MAEEAKFLVALNDDDFESVEAIYRLANGLLKVGIYVNEAKHGDLDFFQGRPTKEDLIELYKEELEGADAFDLMDEICTPNIVTDKIENDVQIPKEVIDMVDRMNKHNSKSGTWELLRVTMTNVLNYQTADCWLKQELTNKVIHHTVNVY